MTTTDPSTPASAVPTAPITPTAALAELLACRTFAAEASIELRDAPAPLFRLLVLASLLAAPVQHTTAIRASLALRPLTRTARTLAEADPDDVSRALTTAGYWRFHHTKAALLVRAASAVVEQHGGDLRGLYREAASPEALHRALRTIPGIGTQAAHIVLREAQGVWPDLQPYLDGRVLEGAARLGLPSTPEALASLVEPRQLAVLAAGCVRATLTGGAGSR